MAKGIFPLVNVSDLDKSIEFYKSIGLKVSRQSEGPMSWADVTSGADALVLYPKYAPTLDDQPADTREWLSGELGKGVLINIGVPNATFCWGKAQQARVDVDVALEENPWGGKGFMVVDPDGYVIGISDRFPGGTPKRAKRTARTPARATKAKGRRTPTRRTKAKRR